MFELPAQQIVYTALNGAISCGVYDTVPFLPEAAPSTTFPYVVIGEDTAANWSTDGNVGASVTLTLHFWSRSAGMSQVKALMAEAYAILNRGEFAQDGFNVTDCLFEFSQVFSDPDGQTKHGVQRYRLTIHEDT